MPPEGMPSSLPAPEFTRINTTDRTPLSLREETARLLANIGKTPAPPPTPEPAPAAPEPEAPAEPENAEPAAPAPDADPAPDPQSPEPDTDPAVDDGETPTGVSRARIRLTDEDKVGQLAASLKSRNRDWTLKQCIEAAEKRLGVTPAAPEGTPAKPAAPATIGDATLPQTPAAVNSAIEQLEATRAAKLKEMDFEAVAKMDQDLRKLDRQLTVVEKAAERAEVQEAANYETSFVTSEQRAAEMYPDAADPESAFGRKMVEIEQALLDTNDDRYHAADKPELIAKMAAKELGIAPRRPGARTAPAKPAAPATPAPKKGMLPTGSSRSAAAPATNATADKVNGIKTLADLKAFQKSIGIRDY